MVINIFSVCITIGALANIVDKLLRWFEPLHDKNSNLTCAPSKEPVQPGHPQKLIRRVFAVRMNKLGSLATSWTHSKGCHYENTPIQIYWKFYHHKNETFQIKSSNIFHNSAQNIDCGYSLEPPNEYPQSMFLSRNKKNNVYPCKPQFYYIKVGLKGVKII